MTRERISRILELREILLSFQTGFSPVNAAVVCAILESISGLEPSSDTIEPSYLFAVSITAVLKVVLIESMSAASLFMVVRGADFPPIIARKVCNTLAFFSFSRSKLSLVLAC